MVNVAELGPGHVRILVEQPTHPALIAAAIAVATGSSPAESMNAYKRDKHGSELLIDEDFGAVPIGVGGNGGADFSPAVLDPRKSKKFLVRAFVRLEDPQAVPHQIEGEPIYSDAPLGAHLTCGSSRPVGESSDVKNRLDTSTLAAHGLDGSGVAIAIVDSGLYRPRLSKVLGLSPLLDATNSWTPPNVTSRPGMHRLGHGTMCAYDALIAAPKATLLDVAMMLARAPGDHSASGTVGAAMQAYWALIYKWLLSPKPSYSALVVSNSWGILHPSLDFPAPHPGRYIDNPNHIFRFFIAVLTLAGADVVFAASNCGADCPSAVCLGQTTGMIMGANAYAEVLTLAACDINGMRVGYSSQGPSIANMPQQKPDLTAYTHFLGSKTFRSFLPDSGTSAACAVAAGCVAALRTRLPSGKTSAAALFQALKNTARAVGTGGWNADYGYGIIRPVEAGRSLGLIP